MAKPNMGSPSSRRNTEISFDSSGSWVDIHFSPLALLWGLESGIWGHIELWGKVTGKMPLGQEKYIPLGALVLCANIVHGKRQPTQLASPTICVRGIWRQGPGDAVLGRYWRGPPPNRTLGLSEGISSSLYPNLVGDGIAWHSYHLQDYLFSWSIGIGRRKEEGGNGVGVPLFVGKGCGNWKSP